MKNSLALLLTFSNDDECEAKRSSSPVMKPLMVAFVWKDENGMYKKRLHGFVYSLNESVSHERQ